MRPSTSRRSARGLVLLAVAVMAASLGVLTADENLDGGAAFFMCSIATVFAVTGFLVATRRPDNAIGWMFLIASVSAGVAMLSGAFGDRWVAGGGGSDLLGQAAAAYRGVSWVPFILLPATFLLLLFPDGRLLSRRWLPIAWCAVAGIAGAFVAGLFRPGDLEDYPGVANPFGVDNPLLQAFDGITFVLLFIGLFGSAASLIVRFRRAVGEQRLQLKWLALAGAVAATTIPSMFLLYEDLPPRVADQAMMISILCLPIATAVAMLRYRLYDVDLVINRALVYGSLTATLAGTYVGSVLLLQLALSGLTEGSGLAVAASTLAVAALFGPARARIQRSVDRRFFRSRYDAARTLESFSSRLRHEVDLTALSADLQGVAIETMQPTHVSLWLRSEST